MQTAEIFIATNVNYLDLTGKKLEPNPTISKLQRQQRFARQHIWCWQDRQLHFFCSWPIPPFPREYQMYSFCFYYDFIFTYYSGMVI